MLRRRIIGEGGGGRGVISIFLLEGGLEGGGLMEETLKCLQREAVFIVINTNFDPILGPL